MLSICARFMQFYCGHYKCGVIYDILDVFGENMLVEYPMNWMCMISHFE